MFTKRHYWAIADAMLPIMAERDIDQASADLKPLADMLEADNPRFDREKFIDACTFRLPPKAEIRELLIDLKKQIGDDYRADEESTAPSMTVTIGWSRDGSWNYQTGDNSFTGGAYAHPHWAVLYLHRRSNCTDLASDALSQLSELVFE